MDRGAARSRKRATRPQTATLTGSGQNHSVAGPSRHAEPTKPSLETERHLKSTKRPDDGQAGRHPHPQSSAQAISQCSETGQQPHRFKKQRKGRQDNSTVDPANFQPKAIRTSAALIYSKEPFPIPPPQEVLSNVRRVDLEGCSDITDLGWLEGTGVTWLSLKGCKGIKESGWEAVGGLRELAGECVT